MNMLSSWHFLQIKDILKGALRFNQSQLEAEENEEITIADDHYCSAAQHGAQQDDSAATTADTDHDDTQTSSQLDPRHHLEQEKEMETQEDKPTSESQVREESLLYKHKETRILL